MWASRLREWRATLKDTEGINDAAETKGMAKTDHRKRRVMR